MQSSTVSVVIPVRNAGPFLAEALSSVQRQTFPALEILFVTPGEDSSLLETLDREKRNDPRIRVIVHKGAMWERLNVGCRAAKGTYVARMDSDDVCTRDRFAKQVALLDARPEANLSCAFIHYFGEGASTVQTVPVDEDRLKAFLLFNNAIPHPTVMMRKSLWEEQGFRYVEKYPHAEDYAAWVEHLDKLRIAVVPKVLLNYRRHAGAVSRAHSAEQCAEKYAIREKLLKRLGLAGNPERMSRHHAIADNVLRAQFELITETKEWFLEIEKANRAAGVFQELALHRVLAATFFSICCSRTSLGPKLVRYWLGSTFAKHGMTQPFRLAKLLAKSAIKRPGHVD